MSTTVTMTWEEANREALFAALTAVCADLEHFAATGQAIGRSEAEHPPGTTALDELCETFRLSTFERWLVLVCAGLELDARFGGYLAAAQGDPPRPYLTFGLALAAGPDAHWSALTPSAPLRHWRLIDVDSGHGLREAPLRIDERILHFLVGASHLDEHLVGYVEPCQAAEGVLVPSHQQVVAKVVGAWSAEAAPPLPVVQLTGGDAVARRAVGVAACRALGLNLYRIAGDILPEAPHDFEVLVRLWTREAALSRSALMLETEDAKPEGTLEGRLERFAEAIQSPLLVAGRERRPVRHRPVLTLEVLKPTRQEQRGLWADHLGVDPSSLNGQLDRLTAQFDLPAPAIASVCLLARQAEDPSGAAVGPVRAEALWAACRRQAQPRLDDLAQRIPARAGWGDLILPSPQQRMLHDIAVQVRHRAQVYEAWGFAARSPRGLGISALFAGPSGTGKTMAAEVLAGALDLDLYRIDLSQVVSKYIGETEKNLRRVFDAAEEGGAILLFDEADALFGKRTEVKDSHDRYANIEVSYLLQRMEVYRGLAILTTNMKGALDDAFQRRLRFIVSFPFPEMADRVEIWRRIFPPETPTQGLDPEKLARLNVTGGVIRNIALQAAFLAAEERASVGMHHVLGAARSEYAKLDKPLTDVEIRGWK